MEQHQQNIILQSIYLLVTVKSQIEMLILPTCFDCVHRSFPYLCTSQQYVCFLLRRICYMVDEHALV